jgi:3-oxoacyl-[acyl-carrier protein] reductase
VGEASGAAGAAFDVSGRAAVVTGAARGIGRAVALELARAGVDLVLGDLDEAGLGEVAEEARAAGVRAELVVVDVSRRSDVEALVSRAVDCFDRLDLMANVAGVIGDSSVAKTREEDLDRILAINTKGVFFGCQAALGAMRERGGGSIVNMASLAAFRGVPALGVYGMSKAAVVALTRTLAMEVGRHGIRVNAVAPGFVKSHMTGRHVLREDGSVDPEQMDDVIADAAGRNPLGIVGEPEDVARTVLYLASDAARYVTGQVLHVNGGGFMP